MVSHGLIDGEPLTDMEQHMFFSLIIAAGSETTRNSIAVGMLALTERPDALDELRDDRSLAAQCRGRDSALGLIDAVQPTHRDERRRDRRSADQGRRQGDAVVGVGQP